MTQQPVKRLYRSRTDRKFAGVCGGIAQYANVDATIIRVLTVLLALVTFGTVLLAYLAGMLLIPEEPAPAYGNPASPMETRPAAPPPQ